MGTSGEASWRRWHLSWAWKNVQAWWVGCPQSIKANRHQDLQLGSSLLP